MPVKLPVNAASGSLPICLCQYGKTDRLNIPVNAYRGERPLSQLGISDIEQASNDAGPGRQLPPQGGKSRELRGVQRPLAKYGDNKSLVSLYFATAIADGKDSWVASIDFTGEKDCRAANTPLPERNNERVASTHLQREKINRQPNTASIIKKEDLLLPHKF